MKPGFKIIELTAFIATEEDGTEGIIGVQTKNGGWMPLVGADTARVESLKPLAKQIAEQSRIPVMMARFTIRKDIEPIK